MNMDHPIDCWLFAIVFAMSGMKCVVYVFASTNHSSTRPAPFVEALHLSRELELKLTCFSAVNRWMVLRDRSEFPKTAQFKIKFVVLQVGAYFKRYSSISFQMLSGQTEK